MGKSSWMAWSSLVVGLYAATCAAWIFFGRAILVLPLAIAGILLGIWHLFRSSRLRKTAILAIVLTVGGLVLFDYGRGKRMERLQEASSRWTGYSSPPLRLTTLDGKTIDSTQFKGKRVLLNFWATWCPPCIGEVAAINAFASTTSSDDVIVIGISDEERAVLEPFTKAHKIAYPIVSIERGKLPMPYNAPKAIPVSFVLDRKGTIQFVHNGAIDEAQLKLLVKDAEDLAGPPKPVVASHVAPIAR
jgi:peroxiredoxin